MDDVRFSFFNGTCKLDWREVTKRNHADSITLQFRTGFHTTGGGAFGPRAQMHSIAD